MFRHCVKTLGEQPSAHIQLLRSWDRSRPLAINIQSLRDCLRLSLDSMVRRNRNEYV
jgi:hypothetical protein